MKRATTNSLVAHPAMWTSGWSKVSADLILKRAIAAGFDAYAVPLRGVGDEEADWIGASRATTGVGAVPVAILDEHADLRSDDADVRERGVALERRAVDLAVRMGAQQLNGVHFGPVGRAAAPLTDEQRLRTARLVGDIADYAGERDVRLVFEVVNRYESNVVNTAEQAMEFISASGSQNLYAHLDAFHMNIEEADLRAAIDIALPRLGYFELQQNHRGALGVGHIDLGALVSVLLHRGYAGPIGVEAFSVGVTAGSTCALLSIWRRLFGADNTIAEDGKRIVEGAAAS